MKTIRLFTLLLTLTFAPNLFAQDTLVATITLDDCVTLDAGEAIAGFYRIDISAFGFASETEANNHFGYIANNYLTYHVNLNENEVILEVHKNRTPTPKDIVWWNDYLSTLCGF
jgi:hypothetical protein